MRLITGLGLFLALAHVWGPRDFGILMYPFTVAGVVVRIVEYGFTLQLVRDIGRARERVHDIVGDAILAKCVLTLVAGIAGVAYALLGAHNAQRFGFLITFLLSDAIVSSFAGSLQTPLRALGAFRADMAVAIASSACVFALVVGTALSGGGPEAVAVAFLIARCMYAVIAIASYRRIVGGSPNLKRPWAGVKQTLIVGFPFGAMVCIGTLATQVDTIVVQSIAGPEATGLYQAGMRIVFGALLIADALHNVFLTHIATPDITSRARRDAGERLTRHLAAFGALFVAGTIVTAPTMVPLLFGRQFVALVPLFPAFGVILLLRSRNIARGGVITIADRQGLRAIGAAIDLMLTIALNVVLIRRWGLGGALVSAAMSQIVLIGLYVWGAYPVVQSSLVSKRTYVVVAAALTAWSADYVLHGSEWAIVVGGALAITIVVSGTTPSEREWLWSSIGHMMGLGRLWTVGAPRIAVKIVSRCGERLVTGVTWVLTWIVPRDQQLWIFGSSYGRRFADNGKYAYLAAWADAGSLGIRAMWVTQEPEIARALAAAGAPVVLAHSWRGLWAQLRAGVWFIDCRLSDIGWVSSRGALRVQLWHGIPLKRIERDIEQASHPCVRATRGPAHVRLIEWLLRPQLSERYDVVISTGGETSSRLASAFGVEPQRVWETGFPRNDILVQRAGSHVTMGDEDTRVVVAAAATARARMQKIVLYMPTFRDVLGPDGGVIPIDWAAMDAVMSQANAVMLLKLHPSDMARLPDLSAHSHLMALPAGADVYPILRDVHVLVTDYSSIYFDFLLCDQPIVHFAYDVDEYQRNSRTLYETLESAAAGPIVETASALYGTLTAVLMHGETADSRARRHAIRGRFHGYSDACASERVFAHVRALEAGVCDGTPETRWTADTTPGHANEVA